MSGECGRAKVFQVTLLAQQCLHSPNLSPNDHSCTLTAWAPVGWELRRLSQVQAAHQLRCLAWEGRVHFSVLSLRTWRHGPHNQHCCTPLPAVIHSRWPTADHQTLSQTLDISFCLYPHWVKPYFPGVSFLQERKIALLKQYIIFINNVTVNHSGL